MPQTTLWASLPLDFGHQCFSTSLSSRRLFPSYYKGPSELMRLFAKIDYCGLLTRHCGSWGYLIWPIETSRNLLARAYSIYPEMADKLAKNALKIHPMLRKNPGRTTHFISFPLYTVKSQAKLENLIQTLRDELFHSPCFPEGHFDCQHHFTLFFTRLE